MTIVLNRTVPPAPAMCLVCFEATHPCNCQRRRYLPGGSMSQVAALLRLEEVLKGAHTTTVIGRHLPSFLALRDEVAQQLAWLTADREDRL
jgi:hypothetical protein